MSEDTVSEVQKRRPGRPKKDVAPTVVEERRQNRDVPTRVPFGGFTYKLEVANKDPNYWYYWFKDRGDNIERALRAGYEFVTRREANRLMPDELTNRDVHGGNQSMTDDVRVNGGRDEFGRDYNLVLMRQPMEFHNEDLAAEQSRTDEVDRAIIRQNFENRNIANKYGDVTMTVKDQE
jgi:hypothetical protein